MEDLAGSIVRPKLEVPVAFRQGTVVSVQWSTFTCTIRPDGATAPEDNVPGVKFLETSLPVVGSTIWYIQDKDDRILVGPVGASSSAPLWPNIYEYSQGGPGGGGTNTNVPNFIDWPSHAPISFNWRKYFGNTQVLVQLTLSGYVSTGGQFDIGVRINGVDYDFGACFFNQTGTHAHFTHLGRIAGIGSGLVSVTFRLKAANGSNLTSDTNDRCGLRIEEMVPSIT